MGPKKNTSNKRPLSETHPEVASLAHGWDPTTVTAGSGLVRAWKCTDGHIWTAIVSRVRSGSRCPYCSNQKVLPGVNDLATTYPEIAALAHGWDPTTVVAGSNRQREWKCPLGHIWTATVSQVTSGSRCPYCCNRKILLGVNDLATTYPEVASLAHGWDPTTVVAGSGQKREWKCPLGHIWTTVIQEVTSGTRCPYCCNRVVLSGYNDLATSHPEIAALAHGWDPRTTLGAPHQKHPWRCPTLGHQWESTAAAQRNATLRGEGCYECLGRKRPLSAAPSRILGFRNTLDNTKQTDSSLPAVPIPTTTARSNLEIAINTHTAKRTR